MPKQPKQQQRKNEHLFLAEKFYQPTSNAGFDKIKLEHDSIPEISLDEVDYSDTIFGKNISGPFMINAMTGGSEQSTKVNSNLGSVAAKLNIPIAVGSMSSYINFPDMAESYAVVRKNNPNGVVIANISPKYNLDQVQKAIDLIDADALQIHVNVLQELAANTNDGDKKFYWLDNIKYLNDHLDIPVIVKEVGTGMSKHSIKKLIDSGIEYIDVSGAGGTDFVQIETERNKEFKVPELAELSISTVESLLNAQQVNSKNVTIIGSGGIKSPLDALKALRLGADYVGMAGEMLHQIEHRSVKETVTYFDNWYEKFRMLSCALGVRNKQELMKIELKKG